MNPETVDQSRLVEALESLKAEISRLGQRVAALEAAAGHVSVEPAPKRLETRAPAAEASKITTKPDAPDAGLSEEVLLVISAAIAAFVGKRAHIRQIRLLGSAAWAQQGRVMIQASHALSSHSPRS